MKRPTTRTAPGMQIPSATLTPVASSRRARWCVAGEVVDVDVGSAAALAQRSARETSGENMMRLSDFDVHFRRRRCRECRERRSESQPWTLKL
jgi:hypothetical protein